VWPSAAMASHIMDRLRKYGHGYRDEHLSYEERVCDIEVGVKRG
jgi:hypothetical protein